MADDDTRQRLNSEADQINHEIAVRDGAPASHHARARVCVCVWDSSIFISALWRTRHTHALLLSHGPAYASCAHTTRAHPQIHRIIWALVRTLLCRTALTHMRALRPCVLYSARLVEGSKRHFIRACCTYRACKPPPPLSAHQLPTRP
jgi:hypothetical protein